MRALTKNFFIAITIVALLTPQFTLVQAAATSTVPQEEVSFWDDPLLYVAGSVAALMVGFGGIFTFFGGTILDGAISYTIVDAGNQYTGGIGIAVNNLWTVIRDLFNLLFIFTLIYIGLMTILRNDSGSKKLLGGVIAAALLINFSLFITKMIIDFSNLAAYQIYNQILIHDLPGADLSITTAGFGGSDVNLESTTSTFGSIDPKASISGAFMESMKLTTFANQDFADVGTWTQINSFVKIITFGFLMMIFMIIAGFSFFSGAILLIIRFVMLIIFMIFSPAMFLIFFFPQLKKVGSMWWNKFISNAFVAPAYLFMIFLSLEVLKNLTVGSSDSGTFGSILSNTDGNVLGDYVALSIYFVIAVAFVYGSAYVAKQMGASGADTAMKIANFGRNSMQGWTYRNTAGRLANRGLKIMDSVSRATGGRFSSESVRRGVESARNYGAGGRSLGDVERDTQTEARRRGSQIAERGLGRAIAAGASALPGTPEHLSMEDAITGANTSALVEQLKGLDPNSPKYKAIVSTISQSQYQKLMDAKPEEFDDTQKVKLKTARKKVVENKLQKLDSRGRPTVDLKDAIKDASVDDLAQLDLQFLQTNAKQLQASQLEKMENHDAFKGTRYGVLETAYKTALSTAPIADIVASRKGDDDLIKLPNDFVMRDPVAFVQAIDARDPSGSGGINKPLLTQFANSKLSSGAKKALGTAVKTAFPGRTAAGGGPGNDLYQFFTQGPGVQMN